MPRVSERRSRTFFVVAIVLFGLSTAIRIAHVLAEPTSDPLYARPGLDAGYYLAWARGLSTGDGGPSGAFYLAPLYPSLLALWLRVAGERLLGAFLVQQAAMVTAAGLLGAAASRVAGRWAGLATAALWLFYQPSVFFASRTLGESCAIVLLALGLALAGRSSVRAGAAAGAALGVAALAKPYLLLVPAAWAAWDFVGKRASRGTAILATAALMVLPVTVRNLAVSGHPVPVSSNGGITLYHGNGPGALGIYTPPQGFSGALATQREEATALASRSSGTAMDDVEADRWWGGKAVRTRLSDPADTLSLVARRALLLVDDYEHGLDDPPALDPNPWSLLWRLPGTGGEDALPRRVSFVPFAAILGLAAAGVAILGFRGTGGFAVWGAAAACAVTPLAFYVSSRYRLPLVAVLTVPAGVGLRSLLARSADPDRGRRSAGWIVFAACAAGSFLVPFRGLRAAEEAGGLANRAAGYRQAGDDAAAERALRTAVAIDPNRARPGSGWGCWRSVREETETRRPTTGRSSSTIPPTPTRRGTWAACSRGPADRRRRSRSCGRRFAIGPIIGPARRTSWSRWRPQATWKGHAARRMRRASRESRSIRS